ncbi:unnamed protein product [Trichogramma brassicae]|uniref:Reverse transcriptase domain-containing protein n=1 Tax=Trichogramma brassicae TaxID=86971 RepID=A0A6H5I317_9HYME|nr:unnamed protein product [Trichogramma brassicae]
MHLAGLRNSAQTFQRAMNSSATRPTIIPIIRCYQDDILVLSTGHEEHARHLRELFTVLRDREAPRQLDQVPAWPGGGHLRRVFAGTSDVGRSSVCHASSARCIATTAPSSEISTRPDSPFRAHTSSRPRQDAPCRRMSKLSHHHRQVYAVARGDTTHGHHSLNPSRKELKALHKHWIALFGAALDNHHRSGRSIRVKAVVKAAWRNGLAPSTSIPARTILRRMRWSSVCIGHSKRLSNARRRRLGHQPCQRFSWAYAQPSRRIYRRHLRKWCLEQPYASQESSSSSKKQHRRRLPSSSWHCVRTRTVSSAESTTARIIVDINGSEKGTLDGPAQAPPTMRRRMRRAKLRNAKLRSPRNQRLPQSPRTPRTPTPTAQPASATQPRTSAETTPPPTRARTRRVAFFITLAKCEVHWEGSGCGDFQRRKARARRSRRCLGLPPTLILVPCTRPFLVRVRLFSGAAPPGGRVGSLKSQKWGKIVNIIDMLSCVSERDYSAQEVAHILMGWPLYSSSRSFVYVNTNVSDWHKLENVHPRAQILSPRSRTFDQSNVILRGPRICARGREAVAIRSAAIEFTHTRKRLSIIPPHPPASTSCDDDCNLATENLHSSSSSSSSGGATTAFANCAPPAPEQQQQQQQRQHRLDTKCDREFVEMEVPFNGGAPKRPGSPSPLTSPAHSTASRGVATGLLQSCCGRCYPQRYQVRGRRGILASTGSISESAQQQSKALLGGGSSGNDGGGGGGHGSGAEDDPAQVPNVTFRGLSASGDQAGGGGPSTSAARGLTASASASSKLASSSSFNETRV